MHLYVVVQDDAVRLALLHPVRRGKADTQAVGTAIDLVTLSPDTVTPPGGTAREGAPKKIGAKVATGVMAVLLWPVTLPLAAYELVRPLHARPPALDKRWRAEHRVLTGTDKDEFLRLFALVADITAAWPELALRAPVPDPGVDLAQLLWDLVPALEHRADLRAVRADLVAARDALQSVEVRVRQDVEDRLAEVDRQRTTLDGYLEGRESMLRSVHQRTLSFLEEERAKEMARAAVDNADAMRGLYASPVRVDTGDDHLRDQIEAIIGAYQELTRDD